MDEISTADSKTHSTAHAKKSMPPRKRNNKSEAVSNNVEASSKDAVEAHAPNSTQDESSTREEFPRFEPTRYRRRSDGVKWFPVIKRLFYVSLLVLVPMILNYAAINHELRVLPPEGSLFYDIGWGQKLLLHCTGTGLPTVILDAPIGQASYVWSKVQPLLAKQTRVCSYDRAGLGFSDRAYQNTSRYADDYGESARERDKTLPSTVERMVDDLHKLLTVSSSQPKPFIMVSSDFTTLVSRFYAQLYEYDLAGLLLIDPAPETLFDAGKPSHPPPRDPSPGSEKHTDEHSQTPWSHHWYRRVVPHLQSLHLSGSLGFNRLGLMVGLMSAVEVPELKTVLSDDVIAMKKHVLCQPKHLSSAFDEYFFMNESISQIKTMFRVKPFPELLPIKIATYKDSGDLPAELTKI